MKKYYKLLLTFIIIFSTININAFSISRYNNINDLCSNKKYYEFRKSGNYSFDTSEKDKQYRVIANQKISEINKYFDKSLKINDFGVIKGQLLENCRINKADRDYNDTPEIITECEKEIIDEKVFKSPEYNHILHLYTMQEYGKIYVTSHKNSTLDSSAITNEDIEKYSNKSLTSTSDSNQGTTDNFNTDLNCDSLDPLWPLIREVWGYMKIYIVIGLIVYTMIDFVKAITSDKPDEKRTKAIKNFVIRFIIAIIFLILPELINFIFYQVNIAKGLTSEQIQSCLEKLR